MESFNGLTPSEAERLALLLEELGEAQQAIGKILRHGYESSHPENDDDTNRTDLEKELGHVGFAISMMVYKGDLDGEEIAYQEKVKKACIHRYLHHQ